LPSTPGPHYWAPFEVAPFATLRGSSGSFDPTQAPRTGTEAELDTGSAFTGWNLHPLVTKEIILIGGVITPARASDSTSEKPVAAKVDSSAASPQESAEVISEVYTQKPATISTPATGASRDSPASTTATSTPAASQSEPHESLTHTTTSATTEQSPAGRPIPFAEPRTFLAPTAAAPALSQTAALVHHAIGLSPIALLGTVGLTNAALPVVSTFLSADAATTTDFPLPSDLAITQPPPAPVQPPTPNTTIDDLSPINVDLPRGVPVAGILGVDAEKLGAATQQVLEHISELGTTLGDAVDVPEEYAWFGTAVVLTGGAGYAVRMNRRSRRLQPGPLGSGSVVARWGDDHDSRIR
jgi:hypothetical protein